MRRINIYVNHLKYHAQKKNFTTTFINMSQKKFDFDLFVIGGGSGGLGCARRAASYKKKVAIAEYGRMGGTCVNVGCVPKKVMWNTANTSETLHHYAKDYGFKFEKLSFDWTIIKKKRDAYIKRLNGIYHKNLDKDGVTKFLGHASLVDANTVKIGKDQIVTAERIVLATGGKPWVPNTPGHEFGIDSDGFFELEKQPKKVAVIGAGYIAVELAGIFASLKTETHIFCRGKTVLRKFDEVITENVMNELKNSGVAVHNNTSVKEIKKNEKTGLLSVVEKSHTYEGYDCLLWAVGRKPNTQGLNLEKVGVKTDSKGYVQVNDQEETTIPNIYALGDIIGQAELTPVALKTGRLLANRLYAGGTEKMDYRMIPTVIFSHPPVGTIGWSEREAREKFKKVKVYKARFTPMFNSPTEHKTKTAIKLICEGDNERVVGLHIIGIGADEMLQGFGVAIVMGATKKDFDKVVAIHPTSSEEVVTLK